jgi:hypothetical protein
MTRYNPNIISRMDTSFSENAVRSISSFNVLGQNLLMKTTNMRVTRGETMLMVETKVTGPNETA